MAAQKPARSLRMRIMAISCGVAFNLRRPPQPLRHRRRGPG